jgi:hypothetical protein
MDITLPFLYKKLKFAAINVPDPLFGTRSLAEKTLAPVVAEVSG